MKILLVLMFIVSTDLSAQCFISGTTSTVMGDKVMSEILLPTTDTIDTCTGYWISPAADIRSYQTVEVTPASFSMAFGFGVSAVLTFWFLPYVGSVAGNVIRKM